jgi:hypothetical protein
LFFSPLILNLKKPHALIFGSLENDTVSSSNFTTSNVNGHLKVLNTINEFNMLDKNKLLDDEGQKVLCVVV